MKNLVKRLVEQLLKVIIPRVLQAVINELEEILRTDLNNDGSIGGN